MPSLKSLDEFVSSKIAQLEEKKQFRVIKNTDNAELAGMNYVNREGKKLISFCSNDYLGLANNELVVEAAICGAWESGAGAGASRLVAGNYSAYDELEASLADIKNEESACVFGSGYLANIGVITALMGKGDLVILDRLAHSSIHAGAKLSGATVKIYSHNDLSSLNNILNNKRNDFSKCFVITETVFSMDGDLAPISDLKKLAEKYNSWLISDDAHGFAVVNQGEKAHIQIGTLSKTVGCYGGYVCGSKILIDYIKSSARSLIYSTALPPSVVYSAIASLEIIKHDPELCAKPLQKAQRFTHSLGVKKAQSSIVALILGDEEVALKAASDLQEDGFLVCAIRPPTVKKNTSRLRFTFSANHKDSDIDDLVRAISLRDWFKNVR